MITLFDELTRRDPPKLKREGARVVSNDPEFAQEVKTKDPDIEKKEAMVKEFMLANKGRPIGTIEIVHTLKIKRHSIANIAAKFWRRGWIDITRIKKKVYYRYLGGF